MSCGSYLGCEYLEHRINIRHPALLKIQGFFSIYAILVLEGCHPAAVPVPGRHAPWACFWPSCSTCRWDFWSMSISPRSCMPGLSVFVPPGELAARADRDLRPEQGKARLVRPARPLFGPSFWRLRLSAPPARVSASALFRRLLPSRSCCQPDAAASAGRCGPRSPGAALFSARCFSILTLAYLVNGLGPYLGLKTNFSFAMFSNLRPIPWGHLLWRASWRPLQFARYVRIETIHGLPETG